MKLSRATHYVVIALAYMARHGENAVTARDIAEAEALPERFLLKLLHPLVRAGLLLSLKGPSGGYRLARPAKTITLLTVVEAVDGSLAGDLSGQHFDAALSRRLQAILDLLAVDLRRCFAQVTLAELAAGLIDKPRRARAFGLPAHQRLREISRLRNGGLTLAAIGARFGITRQAVHDALERANRAANRLAEKGA